MHLNQKYFHLVATLATAVPLILATHGCGSNTESNTGFDNSPTESNALTETYSQVSPSSSPSPTPRRGFLRSGLWGGLGIQLSVSMRNTLFQLDCAHGAIASPVTLIRNQFIRHGKITLERGYTYPAVFRGEVNRNTLRLNIYFRDRFGRPVNLPYVLIYGDRGILHRCL